MKKKQYNRLGETNIASYDDAQHVWVQFQDGAIVGPREYASFKRGGIKHPNGINSGYVGTTIRLRDGTEATITNVESNSCFTVSINGKEYRLDKMRLCDFIKNAPEKRLNTLIDQQNIGQTNIASNGQLMTVIAYRPGGYVDIQFEDGTIVTNKSMGNFRKGLVRNPNVVTKKIRGKKS